MADKQSVKYFVDGSNPLNEFAIPQADFQVELEFIRYNGPFMLEVFRDDTDGSVVYSVNYTNDGRNYFPLDDRLVDLALSGGNILDPPILGEALLPLKIELDFVISGGPSGNLTARITTYPGQNSA